mgnify:CR=1 FL=1
MENKAKATVNIAKTYFLRETAINIFLEVTENMPICPYTHMHIQV